MVESHKLASCFSLFDPNSGRKISLVNFYFRKKRCRLLRNILSKFHRMNRQEPTMLLNKEMIIGQNAFVRPQQNVPRIPEILSLNHQSIRRLCFVF